MNNNSHPESPIKRADLILFGVLGFIELVTAVIVLAITAGRYPGVFLFGAAKQGIVELVFLSLLALVLLGLAIILMRCPRELQTRLQKIDNRFKGCGIALTAAGLIAGWAAATIPPDFFGRFSAYYQWIRPAGIVFGLIGVQVSALYLWRSGKTENLREPAGVFRSRVLWISFGLSVLLLAVSYVTKYGMVAETPLWNVPGIPVSGMQMFLVTLLFAGLFLLYVLSSGFRSVWTGRKVHLVIILLVYTAALLVWGLTPLNGDSLAVEPSLANPQPYPQRDARVHDLGAMSILWGEGINFKDYTDKPLYMVILAVLHLVTGYDYRLLQWALVAVLALIPVLFYLFGRRFHSSLFGVLIAVLVILQHRNAIVLSRMISSVNVKLLVTETFVLMGVILLAVLLFKWENQNDKRVMLLLGGVVGALSLIRLNPLLFIPFIGLVIIIAYWKRKRLLLSRLLLFLLGFAIIFTPWVLSGRNAEGQPYLIVKVRDIFENRIAPQLNSGENSRSAFYTDAGELPPISSPVHDSRFNFAAGIETMEVNLAGFIDAPGLQASIDEVTLADGGTQYLKLLGNHFVHNIMTSLMPLPDVLSRSGIRTLAERDYWDDRMIWDGSLSSGLIRFMLINLALVSLGIASSWKLHRWKGLIPLGLFLVYDLAISVSLTSGGRYIVPIIWVVFLYYALGIVFLLEMLIGFFKPAPVGNILSTTSIAHTTANIRLLPLFILLISVALLVPAANQLVPMLVTRSPVDRAATFFDQLAPLEESGEHYVSGIVLYPVYDPGKGRVTFDFYQGERVTEYQIDFFQQETASLVMGTQLITGEFARLAFNGDNELTGVSVIRDGELLEYWLLADSTDSKP